MARGVREGEFASAPLRGASGLREARCMGAIRSRRRLIARELEKDRDRFSFCGAGGTSSENRPPERFSMMPT